jgi:hypothetical protein
MNNTTLEKFASILGESAVTGNTGALQKEAAEHQLTKTAFGGAYAPLIGAGVGGTIGGLGGYFGTAKEKDKKRNALYGALIGALGTGGGVLGARALANLQLPGGAAAAAVADKPKTPPVVGPLTEEAAAAPAPSAEATADWTTNNPTAPTSLARYGADVGAFAGGRALTGMGLDRLGIGRDRELARLMRGDLAGRVVSKIKGKQTNPYDALKPLFEMAARGENVGEKLAPKLAPGARYRDPQVSAAIDRKIRLLNETLAPPSWRNLFGMRPRMSLGGGAANRAERAAILEEASALAKSKGLAASKIPKNQILTDVAKYRGRHRYGVPTAVGGAAAVGTDILGRILQNYYARQNNAAPTPTPETAAK